MGQLPGPCLMSPSSHFRIWDLHELPSISRAPTTAGGKNGQRCFMSTAGFSPDKLKDSLDFPVFHPLQTLALASLPCSSHPCAEGDWVRSICGKTIPAMESGQLAHLCRVAIADLLLLSGSVFWVFADILNRSSPPAPPRFKKTMEERRKFQIYNPAAAST